MIKCVCMMNLNVDLFLVKRHKTCCKIIRKPNLTLKTTLFEVWTAANFSRNSFEVKKKTGQLCLFNFPKPQFLHLGGCEFMSQKVLWWQKNFVRFELICSYLLIIIIGVSVCLIIGPYQHDIKKSGGWPCPKWNI